MHYGKCRIHDLEFGLQYYIINDLTSKKNKMLPAHLKIGKLMYIQKRNSAGTMLLSFLYYKWHSTPQSL